MVGAHPAREPREARIPESFIDELKQRANIHSIVSRRLTLKKSGATGWVGLCPFHNEKSPSFTVSERHNTYHCFGCGAHGSALSFLIEHDGLPFRDAVKELASECGLVLPATMQGASGAAQIDTKPLYAAMDTAAKFFRHVLAHSPQAIEYLKKRGIQKQTLARFVIGYAPDAWRDLAEAFKDYQTNEAIVQAGLIRVKESDSGKPNRYDTFRDRITFGVRDTRGRIVAFGGRAIDREGQPKTDPKYLNSPESPIFDKSGCLFGLYEARSAIRSRGELVVVEGYMDVVMLAQHGIENAVASMGTAFTRWHMERALTQAPRIIFAFDGDAAGINAAWKALQISAPLLQDTHDIRFLVIPDKLDPDEYVQAHGTQAFQKLCAQAPGFSEYLIETVKASHNQLRTAEDRARFAAQASAIAQRISYGCKLRKILLDQIAQEARMPGAAIKAIQAAQAQRKPVATIWSRLQHACSICPACALAQREDLLELLDDSDSEEQALVEFLRALPQESTDQQTHPDYLASRDILAACVDLVIGHRQEQLRQEIRAQLESGEISDAQYLRAMAEAQG